MLLLNKVRIAISVVGHRDVLLFEFLPLEAMSVVRVERYAGVVPGLYSDNDEDAHLGAEGIFLGAKVDDRGRGGGGGRVGGGRRVSGLVEEGADDNARVEGCFRVDARGADGVVGLWGWVIGPPYQVGHDAAGCAAVGELAGAERGAVGGG